MVGSIVLQSLVSHLERERFREASRRYYSPGLVSAASENQIANLHFVDILMELSARPKGSIFEACIAATSFPDSDSLHAICLANAVDVTMESCYITPISLTPTFLTWISVQFLDIVNQVPLPVPSIHSESPCPKACSHGALKH